MKGCDVSGFQDSNEEFGVLSAFPGQSLARMEAARSLRKPTKGLE